nr:hypothetical protein [Aquitalea sp. ASV15]
MAALAGTTAGRSRKKTDHNRVSKISFTINTQAISRRYFFLSFIAILLNDRRGQNHAIQMDIDKCDQMSQGSKHPAIQALRGCDILPQPRSKQPCHKKSRPGGGGSQQMFEVCLRCGQCNGMAGIFECGILSQ